MGHFNSFFSAGLLCIKWLILGQVLVNPTSDGAPAVRLVDGSSSCSGKVQVFRSDKWGMVCYEGWDLLDANVVCRELGCGDAKEVKEAAFFGQSSGQIWMNKVNCVGNESSLMECALSEWGQNTCLLDLYAGVICQPRTRLVSGINSCSGRVEVLYNGTWGTVCDDGWDLSDAAVVCREMGCGAVIEAKTKAYFGKGSGKIWMDDLNCTGNEPTLSKCKIYQWGVHNCVHSEDAGVICQPLIRLVNNIDTCSGKVEVLRNRVWGTVCGDGWDLPDATVVCREMGCGKAKAVMHQYSFGGTSGQSWMGNVKCIGEETALSTCEFEGWGSSNCFSKYAGVICRLPVRLVNGSSICSGRVEVLHDSQWGTVCDDGWDLSDATVVCRELGCGDAVEAKGGACFGQGSGPVLMNFVNCSGNESTLIQCNLDHWLPSGLNHMQDAGVICSEFSGNPVQGSDLSLKVVLRIGVKTDPRFDPNDPRTLNKLSEEMEKKLQISRPFSLTWKTQPDGKVFQKASHKNNTARTCN